VCLPGAYPCLPGWLRESSKASYGPELLKKKFLVPLNPSGPQYPNDVYFSKCTLFQGHLPWCQLGFWFKNADSTTLESAKEFWSLSTTKNADHSSQLSYVTPIPVLQCCSCLLLFL